MVLVSSISSGSSSGSSGGISGIILSSIGSSIPVVVSRSGGSGSSNS